MRIGVLGINHKLANLNLRELLAKACQRQFVVGTAQHQDHVFVLLSTCNRTEIYFSSQDLTHTHAYLLNMLRQEIDQDFDQKVYSFFGHDCFLHLTRVTTGLDSAIVAETEIQGQVKTAYETAASYVCLPHDMHYLFQKSLNIGKKVRSTLFSKGSAIPDLAHAVYTIGEKHLENHHDAKLLFVGASDINLKIIHFLKTKNIHNITLCNRSHDRATTASSHYHIKTLEWQKISSWHNYEWIVFGTKASSYLINKTDLKADFPNQNKLIIDLSVPRNVDPKVGRHPNITLINIDQLNHHLHMRHQQMSDILADAEKMVGASAQQYVESFTKKEQQKLLFQYASA